MQDDSDKKIAPIKRRIRNYLRDKGISQSDFFKKVGVSGSTFRSDAAKSEFKGDTIAKFLSEYRDAPIRWIMLGEEETAEVKPAPSNEDQNAAHLETILHLSKALSQAQETISRLQEEVQRLRLTEGLGVTDVSGDYTVDAQIG